MYFRERLLKKESFCVSKERERERERESFIRFCRLTCKYQRMLYIRAYDENVRTKRRHPSKEGSPTMMMSTLFPAMLYSFFEQMFVLSPLAVSPVVVVVSSSSSSSSSSGEKRSAPSFHRFAFVVKVLLFSSAATASFSSFFRFHLP